MQLSLDHTVAVDSQNSRMVAGAVQRPSSRPAHDGCSLALVHGGCSGSSYAAPICTGAPTGSAVGAGSAGISSLGTVVAFGGSPFSAGMP